MEINLSLALKSLPPLECVGDQQKTIRYVQKPSAELGFDEVAWVSDKNQSILSSIKSGTIICGIKTDRNLFSPDCTYLLVNNPRLYFLQFVKAFFVEPEIASIDATAKIDPSCKIGENVTIKSGVVIEHGCIIGNNTMIDHNTVVLRNTVIGNFVKIGCNCTIGGVGFGYEKDDQGNFMVIPHIGNVVLQDHVEIGNNTAIDRAVIGSTLLKRNCKIDNLVHIAHGVEIGENSLIIANAMIAGSTIIGANVWVAPSASILNKLDVGDESVVGMGAVVLKNIANNQTVVGNPAKPLIKK